MPADPKDVEKLLRDVGKYVRCFDCATTRGGRAQPGALLPGCDCGAATIRERLRDALAARGEREPTPSSDEREQVAQWLDEHVTYLSGESDAVWGSQADSVLDTMQCAAVLLRAKRQEPVNEQVEAAIHAAIIVAEMHRAGATEWLEAEMEDAIQDAFHAEPEEGER